MEGDTAELDDRFAIAETKREHGEGAWDRDLRDAGLEPRSLSKYRIGVGLLHAPHEDTLRAAST